MVANRMPLDGRKQAWATEALAYADALHNLARYLTGNAADAEDLVQETYARAFRGAELFAAGTHLKAWLFRILRNTFISDWRKRRREDPAADPGEPEPDGVPLRGDAELDRLRGVVATEIQAALMALPEDGRTAVLLHLEGFSEAEMADILGCAAGTVKSRLFRARATLRDLLAEYGR